MTRGGVLFLLLHLLGFFFTLLFLLLFLLLLLLVSLRLALPFVLGWRGGAWRHRGQRENEEVGVKESGRDGAREVHDLDLRMTLRLRSDRASGSFLSLFLGALSLGLLHRCVHRDQLLRVEARVQVHHVKASVVVGHGDEPRVGAKRDLLQDWLRPWPPALAFHLLLCARLDLREQHRDRERMLRGDDLDFLLGGRGDDAPGRVENGQSGRSLVLGSLFG
mmetsp:Transcript_344/g.582  ORF Transcript_344/g.582 Transcript_344/m.582 type:complete len:220 (+) Transcript_344:1453-2112(+)